MTTEDEVRQASDQFYQALHQVLQGNPAPMMDSWSHGADVSTMHPLGGREIGWDQVRRGWEGASKALQGLPVNFSVADLVVLPLGQDAAYTVGAEQVRATIEGQQINTSLRATNVWRREGGSWKMVHHHVDDLPAPVLESLMASAGGHG